MGLAGVWCFQGLFLYQCYQSGDIFGGNKPLYRPNSLSCHCCFSCSYILGRELGIFVSHRAFKNVN